jgi:hypothetical protein
MERDCGRAASRRRFSICEATPSGAVIAATGALLSVEQPERLAAALLDFVDADRDRARPK